MQQIKIPFGKNISSLAKQKNLTNADMASICGVSISTISDWRYGRIPQNLLAVAKLAEALQVSFADLLLGEFTKVEKFQAFESQKKTCSGGIYVLTIGDKTEDKEK